MKKMTNEALLDKKLLDHPLTGEWRGFRETHSEQRINNRYRESPPKQYRKIHKIIDSTNKLHPRSISVSLQLQNQ